MVNVHWVWAGSQADDTRPVGERERENLLCVVFYSVIVTISALGQLQHLVGFSNFFRFCVAQFVSTRIFMFLSLQLPLVVSFVFFFTLSLIMKCGHSLLSLIAPAKTRSRFTVVLWCVKLPMGRACIEHYRLLKRQCVFSHDELVCRMASLPAGTLDLTMSVMVYQDMIAMVEDERKLRKQLLDSVCIFLS